MNKLELKEKGWLKIGELAKKAGVSISTVHYYVQEGLLTAPARTSRNMAYYDPACVGEIKVIQELRTTRFLPLSAIRLLVRAGREGQRQEHIGEMRSLFEQIFHPLNNKDQSTPLSRDDLLSKTGLSESSLKELEEKSMIVPQAIEGKAAYDDVDLRIAQAFQKLSGYGVTPGDLQFYREYLDFSGREVKRLHELIHRFPEHDKISLIGLFETIRDIKENLSVRIFRQEIVKMPTQSNEPKEVKNENTSASEKT